MGKVQTAEIVFVDSPEEVHEVVMSAGDSVRAVRYELSARLEGEKKDWVVIGLYSQYLAAKRADLPNSALAFDDWLDMLAVIEMDEDEDTESPGEAETTPLNS